MIQYSLALDNLDAAVDAVSATWRARAAALTRQFQSVGSFQEHSTIWSEVKAIYIDRQHKKCAYCEKRNENSAIEWDLEHFRPKGKVAAWPASGSDYYYDFPTGDAFDSGYYLLAYHLENYAAACKTCNSPYKHNHFPVGASRIAHGALPNSHTGEEAYLIYPLGTSDEDPENVIAFDGVQAVPKHKRSDNEPLWKRARITIDLLGLNRDELQELRAEWLWRTIWPIVTHPDDQVRQKRLKAARSAHAPFTACTRCFLALCKRDLDAARAIILECEEVYKLQAED